MRKGNFATLFVITAAVALVTVFALRGHGDDADAASATGPLFPGLAAQVNDVTAVTVKSADSTFTIRRDGADWKVDEYAGFPAKYESVKQTLLSVADLQRLQEKTSKPELYGKLGLAEPEKTGSDAVLLTLTGGQGSALAAVLVGHRGSDNGTVYVRRAGDAQCWLAKGDLAPERQATQWMDRDIIKLPSTRVQTVTITHPEGDKAVVSREKVDDKDWTIQDVPADSEPKSAGLARSIAVALETLSFDDVASAEKSPLPADGRIIAVFDTFDGLRVTVTTVAGADKKMLATLQAETTDAANDTVKAEARTLQERLTPWVFTIPDYRAANMRKHLADLIKVKGAPATPGATPPGAAPGGTEAGDEPDLDAGDLAPEPDAPQASTPPAAGPAPSTPAPAPGTPAPKPAPAPAPPTPTPTPAPTPAPAPAPEPKPAPSGTPPAPAPKADAGAGANSKPVTPPSTPAPATGGSGSR